MLLQKWDLGLHREHDVGEARRRTAIRCDTREDPGAPLLIHEAARAVERVDEEPPATVLLTRATREHEWIGDPLGDHAHRFVARQLTETTHERRFAHPIYGVDRVARVARPSRVDRELLRRLPRARVHHG